MRSTFMGLETNKRGLFTQQSALYTTGHNISNANTLGYSRQRVNMQATAGFPGIGLNSGTMPGFLGTGVAAGSIQRIRDGFVDEQYRQESSKLGYWESKTKAISQMEDVLNEPSHYGLQKSLSEFWQSLQDLSANPENSGARAVVIRRGEAVADSFNYMHKSLSQIQTNLGQEIDITTSDVNSILQQITNLNEQIAKVEPNGYMPNDLYDARDMLLDQLSTIVPIEVSYEKSGGRALAIAEGIVKVELKTNGTSIVLVEGNQHATLGTDPNPLINSATGVNQPVVGISLTAIDGTTSTIAHTDFLEFGTLKSLMNSYGKSDGTGLYPEMLAKLDEMAFEFAEKFNEIYGAGFPKDGNIGPNWFFVREDATTPFSAGNIKVNELLIENPELFRASSGEGEEGNGKNALDLSNMQFISLIDGATLQNYFQGVIGQLGVDGQEADKLAYNTATLLGAVEHRRASISSVSLDEEMTDMIRFQQAYNASARMITVIDETLDKIINGMGIVGR